MYRPKRIEYNLSGSSLRIKDDWIAADQESGVLRFSEGTEIKLERGSKSRVTEVTPHGAHIVLKSGVLRARVVHRPKARWQVGAGPYTIDVTGTAFDVDWSMRKNRLEVRLNNGSVMVRGPALQEGIRVTSGHRLVAHAQAGTAELSSLAPTKVACDATPAPVVKKPKTVVPSQPAPSWSDLLTSGNFRKVIELAKSRGINATLRRGSLSELVALSDAARYAGDRALARRALLAQRTRFSKSTEARAAAFILGRMADDQGALDEALHWYEVYLRHSPNGAFAAEALGNKLVVLMRSKDDEAARTVARLYLRRFPRGAHAAYAREVQKALRRP
jgi:TolA-binding protein